MEGVVQLVNRLQSAATLLGDNAASDKTLPSLWELLPSIVVIGGQVCAAPPLCFKYVLDVRMDANNYLTPSRHVLCLGRL